MTGERLRGRIASYVSISGLPSVQAAAARWASDLRVEVVEGGHWLPRSQPSLVARLALEHVEEVAAR